MVTKLSSVPAADSLAHNPALARARKAGLILARMLSLVLIGQITIPLPLTPVPIITDTFVALGVGVVSDSHRDALSAPLLGILATAGAPVPAGWSGGTIVTFSYVISYILIATIAGRAAIVWSRRPGSTVARVTTGIALMLLVSASVCILSPIWPKVATDTGWDTTLYLGLVPFVVGDILKSVVTTGLLSVRSHLR